MPASAAKSKSAKGAKPADKPKPGAKPKPKPEAKGDQDTKHLQQRLADLGYGVKVDGVRGDQTANALKLFQKDHGLRHDGVVGPRTTAMLRGATKDSIDEVRRGGKGKAAGDGKPDGAKPEADAAAAAGGDPVPEAGAKREKRIEVKSGDHRVVVYEGLYSEAKHPRGRGGRWAALGRAEAHFRGSAVGAARGDTLPHVAAVRAGTATPAQRAELHERLRSRAAVLAYDSPALNKTYSDAAAEVGGPSAPESPPRVVGSRELGNRRVIGTPEEEAARGERNARMQRTQRLHALVRDIGVAHRAGRRPKGLDELGRTSVYEFSAHLTDRERAALADIAASHGETRLESRLRGAPAPESPPRGPGSRAVARIPTQAQMALLHGLMDELHGTRDSDTANAIASMLRHPAGVSRQQVAAMIDHASRVASGRPTQPGVPVVEAESKADYPEGSKGGCAMPHSKMARKGIKACPKCKAKLAGLAEGLRAIDRMSDATLLVEAEAGERELADAGLSLVELQEAADSMVKASTPEPFSTSRTSNWVARLGGLPAYVQHIAHDLVDKRAMSVSRAIATAIAIVKRWAAGVGKVHADTRAAAAKAVAEWTKLKAENKARKAKAAA